MQRLPQNPVQPRRLRPAPATIRAVDPPLRPLTPGQGSSSLRMSLLALESLHAFLTGVGTGPPSSPNLAGFRHYSFDGGERQLSLSPAAGRLSPAAGRMEPY